MPRPTYHQRFRVRSYETDPHGRLQARILCQLLQEAATVHAAELGVAVESLLESGVAWVLSRLRMRVDRWPGTDAEIVVTTWPEAANRLLTERRFEIADEEGGRLARAETLWLVLDLGQRRPVRFPAAILEALRRHDLGSKPVRPEPLAPPRPIDRSVEFTVRRSDLDLAGHVNNTSYVEWVLESVPDEVVGHCELRELDIAYTAECRRGESIVSASQTLEGERGFEVRHLVDRSSGGDEVARAHTVWRRLE